MKRRVGWMLLWIGLMTLYSTAIFAQERWVYRYDGPGNGEDEANSIVMGYDGNLYVAGYRSLGGNTTDFTVVSLTASGVERWVYEYGNTMSDSRAHSIIMGSNGYIYAAGRTLGPTNYDFTVVSLTASGAERWVYRYNGPGNLPDGANSIVMGSDGNLYIGGYSRDSVNAFDFTVVSLYDAGGWAGERWVYRYNGPGNGEDGANSIVMGSDGNLCAAGLSMGSGTDYDFTVVGLTPDVGVEEKDHRALEPALLQMSISPIPAYSSVRIEYALPVATEVGLSVYDACGRLVKNLVSTREESGSRVILWDGKDSTGRKVPSGVYFCRLQAGSLTDIEKMILLP